MDEYRRTYGDRCGVARALDIVGERWALLVVRELLLGPKRFSDLRRGLPNVSPDVLSQRLRELEAADILRHRTLDPPASVQVYELTARGHALEPVVLELGRWGSLEENFPGSPVMGVDSAVIALKTLFDPSRAEDLDATYELRLNGDRFRLRVADGRLEVARGAAEDPAAVMATDPTTLAAILWHDASLDAALTDGDVEVSGSRPAVRRFLRLFPLPDP